MKKIKYASIAFFAVTFCAALCACGGAPKAQKIQLSAPQNLHMEGRTLVWDEVEHAVGYDVYFNYVEHETTDNCYDLSVFTAPGTYEIEVLAIGDNVSYRDSEWASYIYEPEEVVSSGYDEKGFGFYLLSDGSGYELMRGLANLEGDIVLPDYYKGLPVKRICDYAFVTRNMVGGLPNFHTGELCNTITTNIKLPAHLESIGDYAFACITKLEKVDIPDTVTEIGKGAFWGCKSLKHVTLPNGLKTIPQTCFRYCALEEIEFPATLGEIGDRAFECTYITYITDTMIQRTEQNFTKIVVPDSVKRIGNYAFAGCCNLADITLPDGLEWLDYEAFDGTAWLESQTDDFVMLGDILYKYQGEMTESAKITVPSNVNYIAGGAFAKTNFAEIVIQDGVKLIGERIFASCRELTQIRLPSDLIIIPGYSFANCSALSCIDIPESVTEIGERVFDSCYSLEKITFLAGLKTIGSYAFARCSALEKVNFSVGLESIGTMAFASCTSLKEVVLPEGLKSIGNSAFINCTALSNVVIPSSVISIGSQAFYVCSALTEVVIPKSVATLGGQPFYGCDNLQRIYYEGTEEEWNTLKKQNNVVQIIGGTASPVLSPFSDAEIYFYSETEPTEEGYYWHYEDGNSVSW